MAQLWSPRFWPTVAPAWAPAVTGEDSPPPPCSQSALETQRSWASASREVPCGTRCLHGSGARAGGSFVQIRGKPRHSELLALRASAWWPLPHLTPTHMLEVGVGWSDRPVQPGRHPQRLHLVLGRGSPGPRGRWERCGAALPESRQGSLALRAPAQWGMELPGGTGPYPHLLVPGKPRTPWMKSGARAQDNQKPPSHVHRRPTTCVGTPHRPLTGSSFRTCPRVVRVPTDGGPRPGELGGEPTALAWVSGGAGAWPEWWVGTGRSCSARVGGRSPGNAAEGPR